MPWTKHRIRAAVFRRLTRFYEGERVGDVFVMLALRLFDIVFASQIVYVARISIDNPEQHMVATQSWNRNRFGLCNST